MIFESLLILPFLGILVLAFGPPTRWEKVHTSLLERGIFRAALGMGFLSYLILALGLLGAMNRTVFSVVIGIVFLLAVVGSVATLKRREWHAKTSTPKETPSSTDSWIQALLAVGIGLAALLMLIGCASPPARADWDGLSYHLAVPKIFLQAGRIYPLPWEHHSNFPFLVQMLYTLGLAFGSVAFAKAFHFSMALLTAGALYAAYRRFHTAQGAEGGSLSLLPAAMFLGAPLVFWESTVAYVDLGATFYAFFAVYAFALALEERADNLDAGETASSHRRPVWLLLAGVMTGFAIGCKTTNGIFLILLVLWWLWRRFDPSLRWRGVGTFALWFLLPAALLAAPWFIKSYLWTGNPVYPFLYGLFGGANWNAELAHTYEIEQAQFGLGRSPVALLLLPWNLTFHPAAFSRGIGAFASLGPHTLALMPLLAVSRPLPRWAVSFLVLILGFIAIWVALTQQIRYLLPLFPVLCLLSAWAAERARVGAWRRQAAGIFVGGALFLTLMHGFFYVQPMIPVALGAMSPEEYLAQNGSEVWHAARFANENLKPNAKILFIEETRGFYFDRAYMWGNPGHHTLIPWESFQTPDQMASWLREHGFTHLLLNRRWMRQGWGTAPWESLIIQGVEQGILRPVYSERGVDIFAL